MEISAFKISLDGSDPPQNVCVYLQSLWFDAKGNWDAAHQLVQDIENKDAAWIHAYLHRKEGDRFNADYWYSKAGRTRPEISLNEEWEQIAMRFL